MTGSYAAVREAYECEFTVERSRFIGRVAPVADEGAARADIAAVRQAHPFATHVCWAYIADERGALARYSDDGEPQGTAGLPILEVLKNKGLGHVLVTVTRYFGGVKLGAGGLVRAYTRAAADAVSGASVARMRAAVVYRLELGYDLLSAYDRSCALLPGEERERTFSESVRVERAVPLEQAERFEREAGELFCGRVTPERADEIYYPFREE